MTTRHVAIVGGGYSGTLQAIELLKRGARVTLIERAARFAKGAAYSTEQPDHLLNVRASGMSAFADEPGHFADWLAREDGSRPADFAQRRVYGRYLGELLDSAGLEFGKNLLTLHGQVISVEGAGTGEVVHLADGRRIEADAVVLAIGNLPPEPTRGIVPQDLPAGVYVDNPWAADLSSGLSSGDAVLLVGTGLTAIDAALVLDSAGFDGRILALSRRGLLPRAHAEPPSPPVPRREELDARCSSLLRYVRTDPGADWRARVDSVRPVTQHLWRNAALAERRRFLRHLRPWWDVHRHRIAPSIAARIEGMRAGGKLDARAGKIIDAYSSADEALVRWRPRGSGVEESLRVRRIVNCTGPQADISRAGDPLLDALLAAGRVRPDPCRIGIDVDSEGRTIDRTGAASEALHAIGPMTRGALWEIVAVPDIRQQVRQLAARLASAEA